MKRSELKRKTPMARGESKLARSVIKKRAPKKRAGHNVAMRDMCRGEPCYLRITGACLNDCVPCHANLLELGKGMGLKVPDIYTVPGCSRCHHQLDQGNVLSKQERRLAWLLAYQKWGPVREEKHGIVFMPLGIEFNDGE